MGALNQRITKIATPGICPLLGALSHIGPHIFHWPFNVCSIILFTGRDSPLCGRGRELKAECPYPVIAVMKR